MVATFGSVATNQVRYVSSTQLKITVPAHPDAVGLVDLRIDFPEGETGLLPQGFRYYYKIKTGDSQPGFRFTVNNTYNLGNATTTQIVVNDFNGDSHPDLLVSDTSSQGVWPFLGDGMMNFRSDPLIATPGLNASGLASCDFNKDGHPDFAVSGAGGSSVLVFLGDGQGKFPQSQTYSVGRDPQNLTCADFNGDGLPDIATANMSDDSISVLLNQGKGAFGSASNVSGFNGPIGIVARDFDLDGDIDLAVANYDDSSMNLFTNNGQGVFSRGDRYAAGGKPTQIATEKLDGDNSYDIVLPILRTTKADSIAIFRNKGYGAFYDATIPEKLNLLLYSDPRSVGLGDFNGDGIIDVALPFFNSKNIIVAIGDGSGNFPDVMFIALGSDGIPHYYSVTADLNHDGDADIISTHNSKGSKYDVTVMEVKEQF
jgi:hypothetical protein